MLAQGYFCVFLAGNIWSSSELKWKKDFRHHILRNPCLKYKLSLLLREVNFAGWLRIFKELNLLVVNVLDNNFVQRFVGC